MGTVAGDIGSPIVIEEVLLWIEACHDVDCVSKGE